MHYFFQKFALFLFGLAAGVTAHAATITSITATPGNPRVGEEVRITINGDGSGGTNCGIRLQFGEALPTENFNASDIGSFPLTFTRVFNRPGPVKIQALGRKVGPLTFGCQGEAATSIQVLAAAAAAPSAGVVGSGVVGGELPVECPSGWQMIAGQKNPANGFTCAPLRPATPLVCGHGLVYFEKDGLIGCKKRR